MVTACNAIGCAFPTRRESAVWGMVGLVVGLIVTLAVVTASTDGPVSIGRPAPVAQTSE